MKNDKLTEELLQYQKEQEEIKEIVGLIGGKKDTQYKIVSTLFVVILAVILIAGIVFRRISPMTTFLVVILIAVLKIIWLLYESQKSMHFQFWILNSLENRINDIDKRQREIIKILKQENKK